MDTQNYLISVFGVVAVGVGILFRRYRAKQLESLSDAEFLKPFPECYSAPADAVLRERNRVAKTLRIPQEKLAPEQSLNALSKRFGYLAEFSVAWSDLNDELLELRVASGANEGRELPSTVGQLVAEFAAAREKNETEEPSWRSNSSSS